MSFIFDLSVILRFVVECTTFGQYIHVTYTFCVKKIANIEIKALLSKKHVVTVTRDHETIKVFQITFGTDGTIFLHFPYHQNPQGLASIVTLDPNLKYPADSISLVKQGKVTSHKIKFSHHTDGEVHFSQTGKVFTRIRRQGVPLDDIDGHIFTVMLQGQSWFEKVHSEKDKPHSDPDRTVIHFDISGQPDGGIKFIGQWRSLDSLVADLIVFNETREIGPQVIRHLGKLPCVGFLLASGNGTYPQKVLVLTIEIVPFITTNKTPSIIFIGGFDSIDTVNDLSKPSSFLALLYPTDNFEKLRESIGSIDYFPKKNGKGSGFTGIK